MERRRAEVEAFKKFLGTLRRRLIELELKPYVKVKVNIYKLEVELYVKKRMPPETFNVLLQLCRDMGMRYNPKFKCWCKYSFQIQSERNI